MSSTVLSANENLNEGFLIYQVYGIGNSLRLTELRTI
jgi:hypothetical protein